ncbi:hypothetical protein [Rhodococcus sp. WAY2]|nr:hypothetical protein [Rhodococcus sp. WAY2]
MSAPPILRPVDRTAGTSGQVLDVLTVRVPTLVHALVNDCTTARR